VTRRRHAKCCGDEAAVTVESLDRDRTRSSTGPPTIAAAIRRVLDPRLLDGLKAGGRLRGHVHGGAGRRHSARALRCAGSANVTNRGCLTATAHPATHGEFHVAAGTPSLS
jgi:hypothetical protein